MPLAKTSSRSRRICELETSRPHVLLWRFWQRRPGTLRERPLELQKHRPPPRRARSEEHTSELQSLAYLVCRLLLEKKKNTRATSLLAPCVGSLASNLVRSSQGTPQIGVM